MPEEERRAFVQAIEDGNGELVTEYLMGYLGTMLGFVNSIKSSDDDTLTESEKVHIIFSKPEGIA